MRLHDDALAALVFRPRGDPATGLQWTYHYFWGLEDVIEVFTSIWDQVPTNETVGLLLPDDSDGNAWGDPGIGLPPALTNKGFKIIDPGRFEPLQSDFSEQVSAFLRGVINHVVEPTSILVTRGAQRAKTNRLDAVGLLRVLALKIHGRSRRLPIIVVQSVEEEDALHSPRSLGRGRRSVPNGPVPPAADP